MNTEHREGKTTESQKRKYEKIGKVADLRKKYNLLKKTRKKILELEGEGYVCPDSLEKEKGSKEGRCELLDIIENCLKISVNLKSHYSVKKLKRILNLECEYRLTSKECDYKQPKALKKFQKYAIRRRSYLEDVTTEVTVNSETSSESGSSGSESESESEPEETNNAGKEKVNNSEKKQKESDEIQVLEQEEDELLELDVDIQDRIALGESGKVPPETHSSLKSKVVHVEKTPSHSESNHPTNDKTEKIVTIRSAGDLTSEELRNKVKTYLSRSKKREAGPEREKAVKKYKPTKIVYEEKTKQKKIPSPRFLPEHRSWQQKSKRSSNNSVTEKDKNVTREKEKELSDKNVTREKGKELSDRKVTRKTQNTSQTKQDKRSVIEREKDRRRIEEERYYSHCAYFNYRDRKEKPMYENPMYENRRGRKYY